METLISTNAIESVREVWWDIRPHPNFGTVELRICDGLPTLDEIGAVAALAPVPRRAVRHPARPRLHAADAGVWVMRENKWRAARYGLDADIVVDEKGTVRPVRQAILDLVEDLDADGEAARLRGRAGRRRADPRRRRLLPAAAGGGRGSHGGDLKPVVDSLLAEMRDGLPTTGPAGAPPGPCPARPTAREDTRHDPGRREAGLRGRRLGGQERRAARRHPAAPARAPRARLRRVRDDVLPGAAAARGRAQAPAAADRHRPRLRRRLRRTGRRPAGRHRRPAAGRRKDVPYASTKRRPLPRLRPRRPHDGRRSGSRMALASLDGLPGTVRLVFQPAEETIPGGATEVVASGVLDGASRAFALHCDPSVPAGHRSACAPVPITAACDRIDITLTGPGGHTARPQLTVDLVDALGRLITDLPGLLSRQVDPALGHVAGLGRGQRRHRSERHPAARHAARHRPGARPGGLEERRGAHALPRGAGGGDHGRRVEVDYVRGLPPVVNDPRAVALMRAAALETVGQRPRRRDAAEHGRRGLRLVRRGGCRSRWPGWAPTAAVRPSTCTGARSTSTSGRSASASGCSPVPRCTPWRPTPTRSRRPAPTRSDTASGARRHFCRHT